VLIQKYKLCVKGVMTGGLDHTVLKMARDVLSVL